MFFLLFEIPENFSSQKIFRASRGIPLPPRNAITKYTANKTKFISGVVKTARRRRKFLGLGTPVVQFTLIFAIQMWTFPQKSDFFQIRNTGNFPGFGEEHFFQIRNTGNF